VEGRGEEGKEGIGEGRVREGEGRRRKGVP